MLAGVLFARGASEEEIETHNNEWVLCITSFDTKDLALERSEVSRVITRKLVEIINDINFHVRTEQEHAYYEESTWSSIRSNTAKALLAKQNERALLLFRGEPKWRYNHSVSLIDSEIERLRRELEEIDNNPPVINREPVFNLTQGNMDFQFPQAPAPGNEYTFCRSQRADAVLTGSVSDYHGRFLVSFKLYTVSAGTFIWEDRIVFSTGDIDIALEEITRRLVVLLSGGRPGAVAISTQPEGSLVLINRSFAGRGETGVMEFPPGRITVTASAPEHESITFETDIVSGELSKININLLPVEYGELEITGTNKGLSGSTYLGAMYVGETPLTLRLPVKYMEYIEIEAEENQAGRIIFFTPAESEFTDSISIRTANPAKQGKVDRARRMFYWSFGGTWIAGIAAWITYYTYNNLVIAYNRGGGLNTELYNDAIRMRDISRGTMITAGALGVLDLILIIRYIYLANRGSTQIYAGR